MSVEFDRGSPGKFDSRTLSRETLNRWTGRTRRCHKSMVSLVVNVLFRLTLCYDSGNSMHMI